jgi:three-Cys-motif partner protein
VSRRRKPIVDEADGPLLFPLPESQVPEPDVLAVEKPLWTEHKARLISRYLYYFQLVTHHGTYFDGFAGPQQTDQLELWAAKLVLELRPRWMRTFHLFDIQLAQVQRLNDLVAAQPPRDAKREPRRIIRVHHGDVNIRIPEVLTGFPVPPREAAFALLDQRTFECRWSTVHALATHKTSGPKIELFYFLAAGWLDRAFSGIRDRTIPEAWWGRPGWEQLRRLHTDARREVFVRRFKTELGYASVKAWPIYERQAGGGRIMYHMIHATDHRDAPALMARAYRGVGLPLETREQLAMEWRLPTL